MKTSPVALARVLCLIGCGLASACGFDLTDDVDLVLDFQSLIGPSSSLHSPYVKGARFGLYLHDTSEQNRIQPSWRLESAQPSILAISDVKIDEYTVDGKRKRYLQGSAVALAEGQTDIIVRDDGGEIFRTTAEVLQPDSIELLAHGPLLIERPDSEAVVSDIQILAGGTGTFMARYLREGRVLSGNGALAAQAAAGVTAEVRKTFLFEDRDWLSLTMPQEGTAQVDLLASGVAVRRVTVTGVSEAAIQDVQLRQSDRLVRGDAKDGDWLVVLAEATDRQGRQLYGVEYKWDFGGSPQQGLGDLYRYEYLSGMHRMLSAVHGSHTVALMIDAKQGFVDSTNHIGCAIGERGRPAALLPLGLLAIALCLRRRRRPATGTGS